MKTSINLLSIFLLILVFSCSENELQPSLENEVVLEESKVPEVPFNSNFDVVLAEVFEYVEGDHIKQALEGQGIATHMGLVKFRMEELVNFTTVPWEADAEAVLTAANGDELNLEWHSMINPSNYPVLYIAGEATITGGTGRFSDNSGNLILTSTYYADEGKGSGSLAGALVKNK